MRSFRYKEIAESLREEIASGALTAGGVLPSEAELSATHGASRVTVRKALELLRDEGLVDSRQGFGWFAATARLPQTLVQLGTIEEQLAASGRVSERRVLDFAFRIAPPTVAERLGTDEVLEVRRLHLADGVPFAVVTVWCPAELAGDLSRADVERASFIHLLPVEVGDATQTIGAASATENDAELLGIPVASPVLHTERITRDTEGQPVLLAEHVYPGHRTEFVVDLPRTDGSMSATGLRLVN